MPVISWLNIFKRKSTKVPGKFSFTPILLFKEYCFKTIHLLLYASFCLAFEDLLPQNVLVMFLFSMKHSYLLTENITPGVLTFFVVWLWPQLSWCSMYILRYSFVSEIYKKYKGIFRNISRRYLNFLFELPNQMFLIGFYSVSLLTKILFFKKVYCEISKI